MEFKGFKNFIEEYQKVPVSIYSEPEISQPLVTVCVLTYNHEKYISKCLDSILEQQTDFDFEIQIGEDASTDQTRKICKEYADKYPQKIKLLLHSRENNISVLGEPSGRFNFSYNLLSATGKYIAVCEGDDFWEDPHKLQKQIDVLENHPECSMCFTAAHIYYFEKDGKTIRKSDVLKPEKRPGNRIYTVYDAIRPAGGFMTSATMIFRSEYVQELPDWYFEAIVGDTPLMLYLGTKGDYYYLDEITAAYRAGTEGSWTARMTYQKRKKIVAGYIQILEDFNTYTNKAYSAKVSRKIVKLKLGLLRSTIKYYLRPLRNIKLIDRIAVYFGN
ncbi:MAG: glycosyltransferase [Balneolaceae bacterium]|nr:glycosyltransferase [Balneolaceae bacterium]